MRVKICGICRPEDGALAFEAGADYVGVVVTPGFSRSRTVPEAAAIYAAAGSAGRAGVFVNATLEQVRETARLLALDIVQLSGTEAPELGRALRTASAGPPRSSVWKVLRPTTAEALLEEVARWKDAADALLLDGHKGGSGVPFDWEAVAAVRPRLPAGLTLVVAGGLTPANVSRAVAMLRPDVVDVSSGVEAAAGEKSPEAVRAFVSAARHATRTART